MLSHINCMPAKPGDATGTKLSCFCKIFHAKCAKFRAKSAKKQSTRRNELLRINLYFLMNISRKAQSFTQRAQRCRERKEINYFVSLGLKKKHAEFDKQVSRNGRKEAKNAKG
ncbi:MAG: hypothetical protein JWM28_1345 [Chitinophagaceae bacterium]|nr:hypothetical protein [Chitinophagaceae bacterium]